MKVVDFLKHKREILAQHPFELKDWLSPAIRDYWREFQQKAHLHPLLGRVLDLQAEQSQVRQQRASQAQAVNSQPTLIEENAVELSGEAATLYGELQARIGEETHVGEWLQISQGLIDQFAAVTGDHQWIHTDPERAAA